MYLSFNQFFLYNSSKGLMSELRNDSLCCLMVTFVWFFELLGSNDFFKSHLKNMSWKNKQIKQMNSWSLELLFSNVLWGKAMPKNMTSPKCCQWVPLVMLFKRPLSSLLHCSLCYHPSQDLHGLKLGYLQKSVGFSSATFLFSLS